jgi:hypothetical protein
MRPVARGPAAKNAELTAASGLIHEIAEGTILAALTSTARMSSGRKTDLGSLNLG